MKVIIYFKESVGTYIVEAYDRQGRLKGGRVFTWDKVGRAGLKYEINLVPPGKFAAALRVAEKEKQAHDSNLFSHVERQR